MHQKFNITWNGSLQSKNYWIYGPIGIGKSRWAYKQDTAEEIYPKQCNKWWGGFKSGKHNVVILDDYPLDGYFLVQFMKIWGDCYAFFGEIKGSSLTIIPGTFIFIITSSHSIKDVFGRGNEDDMKTIERRWTEVRVETSTDLFLNTLIDKSILDI